MELVAAIIIYNVLAAGLLGLTVHWVIFQSDRRPGWLRFLGGGVALVAMTTLTALVASPTNPLRAARLMTYGCFVHLPLYLLLTSLLAKHRAKQVVAVVLVICIAGITVDMFWIEPFRLEVTHYQVGSDRVSKRLRIGLLADFQTDVLEEYQWASLRRLMSERPDVIVMAGDYLQALTQDEWELLCRRLREFLLELPFAAPQGIFAVGGNVDFERWPEIFEGLPVTVLRDTQTVEQDGFALTGLSMQDSFDTQITIPRLHDKLHLVLGHAPNYALGEVDADLLFAGHTHGGQVCLPWLGPIVTFSAVPRAWAAGMTTLGPQRSLFVARGVGMERRDAPRIRFLCRPQLILVDVVPTP